MDVFIVTPVAPVVDWKGYDIVSRGGADKTAVTFTVPVVIPRAVAESAVRIDPTPKPVVDTTVNVC
jgi:hypothetical protein